MKHYWSLSKLSEALDHFFPEFVIRLDRKDFYDPRGMPVRVILGNLSSGVVLYQGKTLFSELQWFLSNFKETEKFKDSKLKRILDALEVY